MSDYYSILGIAKNATQDEVKKAYRKMAHQYHPDKNSGNKQAEAKFKEANNAYETLGDPQKRAQYDRFGSAGAGAGFGNGGFQDFGAGFDFGNMNFGGMEDMFESFFGGNPFGANSKSSRKRGVDLEIELGISLQEAASGVTKTFKHKHSVKCEHCNGQGCEKDSSRKTCGTCNGKKSVYQRVQTIFGTVQQEITCPTCNGMGEIFTKVCKICHGKGAQEIAEDITIDIPMGIDIGQRLKVVGKGEIGYRGSDPGDLFVMLNIKPHKKLVREKMDIFSSIEVDYFDLLLGANRDIETVWGNVEIKIPPLTDPNKELRLREHGMPKLNNASIKGDHHLRIKVKMPTSLTKTQKELIENLRKEVK